MYVKANEVCKIAVEIEIHVSTLVLEMLMQLSPHVFCNLHGSISHVFQ